jgi:kynurenine formamidase
MDRSGQGDERGEQERDEIGAAASAGPEAVRRGLASVVKGKAIALAAPIRSGQGFGLVGRPEPLHLMLRSGADYAAGLTERAGFGFADDVITLATHGATHVDALAHVWREGLMYNDFPANQVTSRGAKHLGIDKMPPIVTRGVLVDCAPDGPRSAADPIDAEELEALVAKTGVSLEAGDALFIRTGWMSAALRKEASGAEWPGLHHDCGPWLAERQISVLGADNPAIEVFPSMDPSCQVPLHIELIRGHGIYFVELMALDALNEEAQPAFLFSVAPLPLVGGVGSPVAPIAVV